MCIFTFLQHHRVRAIHSTALIFDVVHETIRSFGGSIYFFLLGNKVCVYILTFLQHHRVRAIHSTASIFDVVHETLSVHQFTDEELCADIQFEPCTNLIPLLVISPHKNYCTYFHPPRHQPYSLSSTRWPRDANLIPLFVGVHLLSRRQP